ncbi:hypothetical protein KEM56_006641 [Ascosphaera pollenicola]|nr:hypothetical protein KEM56_006641 [Ascosphaera pollenicola]
MREFDCVQCKLSFNTEKELIKHKSTSDRHEFCKRCNEDFENEEALLVHKILSQRHIACHVCGVDFKSESGKDAHVRQLHRAQQDIVCVGCTAKFTRAAALIAHIEAGKCIGISAEKYHEIRQRKDVLKEAIEKSLAEKNKEDAPGALLLDIGGAMANLTVTDKKNDEDEVSSKGDDSSQSDMMNGGVSLLGGPTSKNGSTRTKPSKHPIDLITGGDDDLPSVSTMPVQAPQRQAPSASAMPAQPLPAEWPPKPSQAEKWPAMGSRPSSGASSSALKGPWAKGAPPTLQSIGPASSSKGSVASFANVTRQSNGTPSTQPQQKQPQQGWAQGPPPSLRKGSMDTRNTSQNRPQKTQDDKTTSLGTQSLLSANPRWDSSSVAVPPGAKAPEQINSALAVLSGQWDPSKFWNSVVGQYVCACEKEFDSLEAFDDHVHSDEHMKGSFQCPGCLRLYKSVTALVAHCESASVRCAISRSDNFSKIMSDISAGVLDTDGLNPDGSVRYKAKEFDMNSIEW